MCKQYVDQRGLSMFLHDGAYAEGVNRAFSSSMCEDCVSGFLADHVDGADDEEAGDARED